MLFLVRIPSLPKRIQQNADSESEAIRLVFDRLPDRLRKISVISDCSAVYLEDPMTQFIGQTDTETEDGSI